MDDEIAVCARELAHLCLDRSVGAQIHHGRELSRLAAAVTVPHVLTALWSFPACAQSDRDGTGGSADYTGPREYASRE